MEYFDFSTETLTDQLLIQEPSSVMRQEISQRQESRSSDIFFQDGTNRLVEGGEVYRITHTNTGLHQNSTSSQQSQNEQSLLQIDFSLVPPTLLREIQVRIQKDTLQQYYFCIKNEQDLLEFLLYLISHQAHRRIKLQQIRGYRKNQTIINYPSIKFILTIQYYQRYNSIYKDLIFFSKQIKNWHLRPFSQQQNSNIKYQNFKIEQRLQNSVWEQQASTIYNKNNGITIEQYKKYCLKMKVGTTSKTCSICFQKFQSGEIINQLPCKHIFHKKCIKPWLKQSCQCPNCRFDIKQYDIQQKKSKKLENQKNQSNCPQKNTQQSPIGINEGQNFLQPQDNIIQYNQSTDSL